MKLLQIFFYCTLFSAFNIAIAQTKTPNVNADFIKIDPYGNIYTVEKAQISKFSLQGKLLYTYSNQKLGLISSIDVFNPMKIMLFYQDAGIIVFLNEQLALLRESINLSDAGYYNISLASYSAANQIHLYDNASKFLITLDFSLREISKTPLNFNSFNPTTLIELEEKNIAFHDPMTGIYLFDTFGTFNKLIPIITPNAIEITSTLIYYTNNDELILYNYKTLSLETQQLPISNVQKSIIYRNNRILLLLDGTIWIY